MPNTATRAITATPAEIRAHSLASEATAEFLGTFVLLIFGTGVVAQTVLSSNGAGSILEIHIAWGLGVVMGVYVAGGISGAHLNPAVSVAMAVRGVFPWSKVPAFCAAQTAGAFAASAVTLLTYREAFTAFDGGVRQVSGAHATAGIFATYPQPYLSIFGGFVDQFVGTALLLLLICALTDQANFAPPARFTPILVGLAVVVIGQTFGFNAGYAINPARDFGPRVFTAVAGWGSEVFRAGNSWWWVPIVAPLIGGIAGVMIYDLMIARRRRAGEAA